MRNTVIEFFAHQLNTDPDTLSKSVDALSYITDKKKVLESLYEENQEKIKKILSYLKLDNPSAGDFYKEIEKHIGILDKQVFELLGKPSCTSNEGLTNLIGTVLGLHQEKFGFFIKREVAKRLLAENPPKNIMRELGATSVEAMLEKEDLFEVYAALRFMEDRDWLNATYLAAYRNLTAADFETRPIEIRVLDANVWQKVTEGFAHKKRHPMSHLKELGLIFLIPSEELKQALTIYLFGMTSHYVDEVTLYSNYFKYYSKEADFGEKIVSAIRGNVPDVSLAGGDPNRWLVIQRYLFKEDPADPRLGVPHISSEAFCFRGASHNLLRLEKMMPDLDFELWKHTNYVAAWFPDKDSGTSLINFNLMDNILSVMNKLAHQDWYSYHFHEALWNKIFIDYFGVEKLEEEVIKHLLDGWFDIRKI